MDVEDIQRRVDEIKFWYHRIELPGGVITTGSNPLSASAYRIPPDLTGKRVLDVGAWDGYWTFEALRRGAREVVAIDDFSDFLGHLAPQDRHAWKTFDTCREAFGYSEDRCKRIEMSLYDVTEENLGGRFDTVFLFGTLYHLRHPLLGLDKLSAICDGEIFVESQICDDYSPYQGGLGHGYPNRHVVAEFFPANELGNNVTNWWAPSLECLKALVSAAGFSDSVSGWKLVEKPERLSNCRGFATGRKPPGR
jgi:tRNA (mo5U34)-methyltransferase